MNEDRRITDPFRQDLHKLTEHIGEVKETLVRIEEKLLKVEDHHRTLYGTGGIPGLTITVDRLDQAEKSRNAHFMAAWVAIVGLIMKSIWDMITHKP